MRPKHHGHRCLDIRRTNCIEERRKVLQLQKHWAYLKGLPKKEEEKKIFRGKELHTYIRGIMKEMTDEERERFMEEAEETGF